MRFFYESYSNKPQICKIINIHTNRIYISQAVKFERCWYDYKRHLFNGKHQNKFFLNVFNKCKKQPGYEFYIIKITENSIKKERNHKEEFYKEMNVDGLPLNKGKNRKIMKNYTVNKK